jgi:D-glycero-alpha-D-manno-heptose-7-phosphate kinase
MTSISVSAPTRIADLGGWTDTWFAQHGVVCHLAVWPGIEVTLATHDGPPGVEVRVPSFEREWHWSPGTPAAVCPDPLLGACLDENEIPDGAWLLEVRSDVPPGAAMGTSASVCVAVLRALDRLRGVEDDAAAVVRRAHAVETRRLGQQSGVQDQWAAAAGGINLVTVARYPDSTCADVVIPVATRTALQAQLLVVLLPAQHASSMLHDQVIQVLGPSVAEDPRIEALRACARDGVTALTGGDLEAYGAVLTRNTDAQADLHPALVPDETRQVIAQLPPDDLLGWKVNGAGGTGGSLTLLATSAEARARLVARIADPLRVLDVRLAPRHPELAGRASPEVV